MILYVGVALALALGALVQTVAGFGSALVAMPVLTQILGVKQVSRLRTAFCVVASPDGPLYNVIETRPRRKYNGPYGD